ncbi:MAG: hypothetical protein KDE46_11985 [Caldilineaceae bacterium]|nr:hypothetical protein [Caldilineaceae bacterium]
MAQLDLGGGQMSATVASAVLGEAKAVTPILKSRKNFQENYLNSSTIIPAPTIS